MQPLCLKAKRLISFFTVLIFILTQNSVSTPFVVWAQPFAANSAGKIFPADPRQVKVPENLGTIEDFFQGVPGKTVVVIQDAHAIPDAQKNIHRLIHYFQTEYGINVVGLEGASSQLDPQIFRSFPDKKRLKQTFKNYLMRGELTGGTAAAIFNESKSVYRGIEDWNLYEEGLRLYQQAMAQESVVRTRLEAWRQDLEARKQTAYSKGLLEIDRAFSGFQQNKFDLLNVLKKLAATKPPEAGSELVLILQEPERALKDQTAVEGQLRTIADRVKKAVESAAPNGRLLKEINQRYQEFQTGQMTPQAFALYLKELIENGELGQSSSPADRQLLNTVGRLAVLAGNQKKIRDIEGTKFFRDFEKYAQSVKETLFQGERDRLLDQENRRLFLFEKLNKLELGREEWGELNAVMNGRAPALVPDWPALQKDFTIHFDFYHNTQDRDASFLQNLERMMSSSALLVAGGFHAHGVTERLKEKGISYLLLMPKIKTLPEENHYRDHMRGNVSWKNYFEVENGRVSLYKAFVRAARDHLIGSNISEPAGHDPRLLKNWRDQIIRDLAKENRLADAGKYTKFIDEKTDKKREEKITEEAMARVGRFIRGLRSLKQKGRLTKQNIVKLLQPAAVVPAPEGPDILASDDFVRASLIGIDAKHTAAAAPSAAKVARSESRWSAISEENINENLGMFSTAGRNGRNRFTFSFGLYDNRLIQDRGLPQPNVLVADLEGHAEIESFLFQNLFFQSFGEGYGIRYGTLNKELTDLRKNPAANTGAMTSKEAEIAALIAEAKANGFEFHLVKGLFSRRAAILVRSDAERQRVKDILTTVFIDAMDKNGYRQFLLDQGYNAAMTETIAVELDRQRSFTFPGGLFHQKSETDIRAALDQIVSIEVLNGSRPVVTLSQGEGDIRNEVKVELQNGWLQITESGATADVDTAKVSKDYISKIPGWNENDAPAVQTALDRSAAKPAESKPASLHVLAFGNADPTPGSKKKDFSNLMLAYNGRVVLVDPSTRTFFNLQKNNQMSAVDAIYLSHVHNDHVGGLMDYIKSRHSRGQVPERRLHLAASRIVLHELVRLLGAETGLSEQKTMELLNQFFDIPETVIDGAYERLDLSGNLAGLSLTLNRTFGHPTPTYGFKAVTREGGSMAYLVDSTMPPKEIVDPANPNHKIENPRYREHVAFFGNADLLISENGVPGVHTTPDELYAAFPGHVEQGTIYTVHSALDQIKFGLKRLETFSPVAVIPQSKRKEELAWIQQKLLDNQAIRDLLLLKEGSDLLTQVARSGEVIDLENNQVIFRMATPIEKNPYVYIILEGKVGIEEIGQERIGGDIVGEIAVLSRAIYPEAQAALRTGETPIFTAYVKTAENANPERLFSEAYIGGSLYAVWNLAVTLKTFDNASNFEGLTPDQVNQLKEAYKQSKPPPRNATVTVQTPGPALRISAVEFQKLFAEHHSVLQNRIRDFMAERTETVNRQEWDSVLGQAIQSKPAEEGGIGTATTRAELRRPMKELMQSLQASGRLQPMPPVKVNNDFAQKIKWFLADFGQNALDVAPDKGKIRIEALYRPEENKISFAVEDYNGGLPVKSFVEPAKIILNLLSQKDDPDNKPVLSNIIVSNLNGLRGMSPAAYLEYNKTLFKTFIDHPDLNGLKNVLLNRDSGIPFSLKRDDKDELIVNLGIAAPGGRGFAVAAQYARDLQAKGARFEIVRSDSHGTRLEFDLPLGAEAPEAGENFLASILQEQNSRIGGYAARGGKSVEFVAGALPPVREVSARAEIRLGRVARSAARKLISNVVVPDRMAGIVIQIDKYGWLNLYLFALNRAAWAEIYRLRKARAEETTAVRMTPEMAEFALGWLFDLPFVKVIRGFQGSLGLVYGAPGGEQAFAQALKQGNTASFLTTVFVFKGVDIDALGAEVNTQQVANSKSFNPMAMDNRQAMPGLMNANGKIENPRLFPVTLTGNKSYSHEFFFQVVAQSARVLSGLYVSTQIDSPSSLQNAEIRQKIIRALNEQINAAALTEGMVNGLFTIDAQGQLSINQDILFTRMVEEFNARAETRKAA